MLSLRELQRAARILDKSLSGAVLQRVVQADDFRLALAFRMPAVDLTVLLSCRPEFARICIAQEMPEAPPVPPSLAQYMRAHLNRASFERIRVAENDRQLGICLGTAEGIFEIILSILGARSNIYLLDAGGKLVHAMRPLDQTRNELVFGGPWTNPAGTLRSAGTDRRDAVADADYLQSIDRTYRDLERKKEIEDLTRRIMNALDKEEAFLGRKARNLQEDLGEARQAAEHKRKGELLKSVLHAIKLGNGSVTAIDYQTGEAITILLDPSLSPAQNLEAYFGRYRKELRGVTAIEQQLDASQGQCAAIELLRQQLRCILAAAEPDLAALRNFALEPPVRKLLSRYYPSRKRAPAPKPAAGKKEAPSRLLPKRYRTGDGLEVWVGRSDEGNDYLTTRLARGNDLFFHLEGYPGSHVVLRTEGRLDPPPEAILAACELAVHFSKLKNASRADVHLAHIKDIRKPKGAKPGLVYVAKGKSIHLRRDPKRLEDILSSRLDE